MHLWADRFDIGRMTLGHVDDIVQRVVIALYHQLVKIESTRSARERPVNPDATDVLLQARALNSQLPNPQLLAQTITLYERAVELDPYSTRALVGLAEALIDSVSLWGDDPSAPTKFRRAEELTRRAELLHPDNAYVMWVRVHLLGTQGRWSQVTPAAQRAIETHPNMPGAHFWLGMCLMHNGRAADAISELEQSLRLRPRNPNNSNRYRTIGLALIFFGKYEEAILWLQRSLAANPTASPKARGNTHAAIAAAQALAGQNEEAHLSAAEASRLWPALTARGYYQLKITNPTHTVQVCRLRDALRLAGIRDHACEDADFGVVSDEVLHTDYEAATPTTVPGARTIRTPDLAALMEQRRPLVLDSSSLHQSIPGAIGLRGAGIGGSVSDEFQDRLRQKMQQLTNRRQEYADCSRSVERGTLSGTQSRPAARGTRLYKCLLVSRWPRGVGGERPARDRS